MTAAALALSDERVVREQLRLQARWDKAEVGSRRLAEYLAHRGLQPCDALRLNPREVYFDDDRNDLGSFPAMLAQIQASTGEPVAHHRTYLDPSGPGKLESIDGAEVRAKKITTAIFDGATRGAAIRLVDPAEGEALAITEGIETALAVHEATGVAVWAAVSAVGVESIRIPELVKVIEIYCDNDKSRVGEMAAQKAAKRLRSEGRTVHVLVPPKVGSDWLDVYVESGADAIIAARMDATDRARLLAKGSITGPGWVALALQGAPATAQESIAARLVRYFAGKGLPDDVVLELLSGFADRCSPPMPMREVYRIFGATRPVGDRSAEPLPEKLAAVEHVSVSVARALEVMQAPKNGLSTPFAVLNQLIVGGFQPGELIYLGARPGVGKTAIALEIARHGAKRGKRVLIVSREMLAVSLARRMLAQEGQLSAKELKLGTIDMSEVARVAARLSDLSIWITDSSRTLAHVADAIDGVPNGIDLLIVDYLQLMNAPKEIRERRLQVESVSQGLKTMALSRQLPIICLSSLVRPTQGPNAEPTLASLRESGELEHDADIVMFLHRPSASTAEVQCIVAKNRDGETGRARLIFKAEWVAFCAEETRFADEDATRWGGA